MNQLSEWRNRPLIARLFDILFLIISIATFRHTTAGFASIEGSLWAGGFSAIAIDVTMYLAAMALNSNLTRSGRFAVGMALLFSASASAMAQLLFSITHAQALVVVPAAEWLPWAQNVINYRVVWMPFSLPIFALLVTAAGKAQESEGVSVDAYREMQNVARDRELELDTVDAQHKEELDELDAKLLQARVNAARGDDLRLWVDTLRSFGVATGQEVAATLTFLHNGKAGTQEELAGAMSVSKSTVRAGQARLREND